MKKEEPCGCDTYAGDVCEKCLPQPRVLKPSEQIREIWDELKQLQRWRGTELGSKEWREQLEQKYENIETLFGHISTETKAIIYYLDTK